MTTRSQWAELLLDAIPECTSYQDGVLAVVAWGQSERSYILAAGGAKNNLLDTERRWPGSSNFNSAGVQNYATQADGIAATVARSWQPFAHAVPPISSALPSVRPRGGRNRPPPS
jgi:hypothetical protein